ncbi:PP2C family protein-serine/threonine phosphatase [Flavimaricola marinus]|uniref:Serine/threonine phosphatase stp n=1 Tax=Flavimaricola marinus TaxID=1819565 RepID=A0A238LCI1_9RHOB|nr:protein phosphatase 2C domain-containing protein [Flavimaricola marinus]SMY07292.1 Serine/threonine phosphatase stp [Flavimaricola marinus]
MHDAKITLKFDHASAIGQGGREYQQDAVIGDFSNGADICFAILADGMGGHAAGDVASKIVVTEVFREMTFQRTKIAEDPTGIPHILQSMVGCANSRLNQHTSAHPETIGMGSTLVACVVVRDQLHWISVGDSPLYLFRNNILQQINEDHSLGPHIDLLVQSGVLTIEEGAKHPERNVLTSVLAGQDEVAHIDCPTLPFRLKAGDTIIVASDGLQYLSKEEITQVLVDRPMASSAAIVEALMSKLESLNDPDLDNVSISLVQARASEDARQSLHFQRRNGIRSARDVSWPFGHRDTVLDLARNALKRTKLIGGSSSNG